MIDQGAVDQMLKNQNDILWLCRLMVGFQLLVLVLKVLLYVKIRSVLDKAVALFQTVVGSTAHTERRIDETKEVVGEIKEEAVRAREDLTAAATEIKQVVEAGSGAKLPAVPVVIVEPWHAGKPDRRDPTKPPPPDPEVTL